MSGLPDSPYKGLASFEDSELDALLFFGRERDIQTIAANLIASRFTVLRTVILPMADPTVVLPGHGPRTTIERERATNPFLQDLPAHS